MLVFAEFIYYSPAQFPILISIFLSEWAIFFLTRYLQTQQPIYILSALDIIFPGQLGVTLPPQM